MIENIQFLRPDWFFAFIPLALFLIIMLRRHNSSISWKAVCDEQLLPHVLTQNENKPGHFPLWLVMFAVSLSIVAAAGPAWKKLPQPVFREQSALVILMDLSKSMDATDLKPSRLERAKLKVLDILNARRKGQTALIVYAADAFVVTPLTDDNETIANLIPTLETELMPAQGSNAGSALEKAGKLLKQAGVNEGEILLITDSISENVTEHIHSLRTSGHRISVFGIGTADGSPIPMSGGFLKDANGAIVIPKLQPQQLNKAANAGGGIYVSLQVDDSDTEQLVRLFDTRRATTNIEETQFTADIWHEEGPWLLLLVLPFAALWSRKGWLLILPVLTSAVLLTLPEPAYAFDPENLWSSPDQRAMKSFTDGNAARAAELFQQERWKSSAHYRAMDYEKSVNALKQPTSSDDFYNKGNALAKLGRYPQAIDAYEKALKLNEDNKDAAYNQQLVKEKLEQQNDQQSNNDESSNEDNNQENSQQQENTKDDNSSDKDADQSAQQSQKNEKPNSSNEMQSTENENQDEEENLEKNIEHADNEADNEVDSNDESSDENQTMAMNENEMTEDEQATEQWLKMIPDDPGGLLRRKFIYQYKRMPHKSDKQPW